MWLSESAKKEYFDRNFAWHAITQQRGDLTANLDNATIMFLRPVPDSKAKDRLGVMKTTYNLKQEPEITSAFYFDMALRTFLAVREMLQVGAWPMDIKYLNCDNYDGTNTPDHTIDLKSYFVGVSEPTTYGSFEFNSRPALPFNGYSYMKFDMDINAVSIRGGASVNTKNLGFWTSGLDATISIKNQEDMKNLTADVVYRIYTVVVSCSFRRLIEFSSISFH